MKSDPTTLSRAEFLKTCSKAALLAAIGYTAVSCSGDSGPTSEQIDDPTPDDNNQGGGDTQSGITVDGDTITIDLNSSEAEALTQAEGWLNITQDGANTLVINIGDGYRAFDNNCPHASCRTNWQFSNQRLTCTCHNSVFNNQGERLAGPAPSGLSDFTTQVSESTLTIRK